MIFARSTTVRLAAGTAIAALALVGCGSDDDPAASPSTSTTATTPSDEPSDEPSETPSHDMSDMPTTSEAPSTSATPKPSTPAADKPIAARARVTDGQVITESDTYAIAPGDSVRIAVKSDTANELHVHGVEQELALEANVKGVLEFVVPADLAPGQYEVELHDPQLLLFTLVVS